MLFIWGKRTYGSVDRVGNAAIKTVFRHLWYLPLLPVGSYYIAGKNNAAFELNRIHGLSTLFGYLRPWLFVAFAFLMISTHPQAGELLPNVPIMAALLLGFIASYLIDKKMRNPQVVQLRKIMEQHFGMALDPYACRTSLQLEINQKMQASSTTLLDDNWHKQVLADLFSDKPSLELAMLRARCDQHDKALQELVLKALPRLA
ncbi:MULTISPECIES: hypothetical protein [unclassified Janthinobacterium]|uniref:hypothetical protein n=1 Tax=unclassified Janthinobacterium TaxID=2610881 RepID=UPI001613B834|nr:MULTISPECIES: hypothetical protein [unclassified Janthinobacterium]MBB5606553.1 hypothetical protein [Janthinobacterium sp. S3T4]MBB5611576.1 hypothetical protein [Janthinobacterium sp. S3M3]